MFFAPNFFSSAEAEADDKETTKWTLKRTGLDGEEDDQRTKNKKETRRVQGTLRKTGEDVKDEFLFQGAASKY